MGIEIRDHAEDVAAFEQTELDEPEVLTLAPLGHEGTDEFTSTDATGPDDGLMTELHDVDRR